MKLTEIAKVIGADYEGPSIEVKEIRIDSRIVEPGDLFIAIHGERFDGHDFIDQAIKRGAVAVVVTSLQNKLVVPQFQVTNTRHALGQIAAYHRRQQSAIVMAVTGSCGKTTVKTLLASILSHDGETLCNLRSFNNDIGVPLTLLQIRPSHQYAVVEMGTNHPGEIAYLTHLGQPDVAAITNAAAAHLEGLGDVQGVACAKAEIFQGLQADGVAIINADDDYANFWKKQIKDHRIVTFGRYHKADVMAKDVQLNQQAQASFMLELPKGNIPIQLKLIGEHSVMNALTAAAMAYSKGVPLEAIKKGLESADSPENRMHIRMGISGTKIIDDTYNANPLSTLVAISVLSKYGEDSVMVLGDMGELGDHSNEMHQQIGEQAERLGIKQLYCLGDHSRYAAHAFGENAYHFTDQNDLLMALRDNLHAGMTVLVKGSHSMRMDQIAKALILDESQKK